MIPANAFEGQTVGVFGLARSGLSAIASLQAGGARILAWDDDETHRAEPDLPVADLYDIDFAGLDALVVAPGVPLTHPEPHPLVKKATAAATPIIGDIEIFARCRAGLPGHRVAAVTGTNGKSTTTALLAHVLNSADVKAARAGNIGVPLLGLDPLPEGGVYVLELSSFQLDLTLSLDAEVAILLNLTPDHLDRHGDMAGYARAKKRLFDMQGADNVAIIGVDDQPGRDIAAAIPHHVIPISVERRLGSGVWVEDGRLLDRINGAEGETLEIGAIPTLRGRHNWQNAAAVYAAARVLGLTPPAILEGLRSFPGLAHRLEPVGEAAGVLFVNDSKASNTDAALKALEAYDNIYWIAGGRFKESTPEPLASALSRVRAAYLVGEAAPLFDDFIAGRVPVLHAGTIAAAVEAAARDARAAGGGVVMLAPACASFDQYDNFEERGEDFRRAAMAEIGRDG